MLERTYRFQNIPYKLQTTIRNKNSSNFLLEDPMIPELEATCDTADFDEGKSRVSFIYWSGIAMMNWFPAAVFCNRPDIYIPVNSTRAVGGERF